MGFAAGQRLPVRPRETGKAGERDAPSAGQPERENQIAEHARSDLGQDLSDPGAVPGASTANSPDGALGCSPTTEQCSVEIAKVVPKSAPVIEGCLTCRVALDAEKAPPEDESAPEGESVEAVVRWCRDCLNEGVRTAVDCASPVGARCTFHGNVKCARKGPSWKLTCGMRYRTGSALPWRKREPNDM